MTIKLNELQGIGETTADSKERVTLARAMRQLRARFGDRKIRFHVFIEQSIGAIVLAPATTVPLREAWLHENPKAPEDGPDGHRSGRTWRAGKRQVVRQACGR